MREFVGMESQSQRGDPVDDISMMDGWMSFIFAHYEDSTSIRVW